MTNYKLIIFDADGTLRRCTVEGQSCPNAPDEWELLPDVKRALAEIDWGSPYAGRVAYSIASNQSGIARGYVTREMARRLLEDMAIEAFGARPGTDMIQMCPHHPDDDCPCRKPKPFMLERLMWSWRLSPRETLFVGDMESDRQAAENAGCDFVWARDFFKWSCYENPT